MIHYLLRHVVPAGYALLPASMVDTRATALLFAIGLQESRFLYRRQLGSGPAHGFWQFERSGVRGVLHHAASRKPIADVLKALVYPPTVDGWNIQECHNALTHNDTLAFCFARALLWTLPSPLPKRDNETLAYNQYLAAWRPGKPRPETWAAHYREAWEIIEPSPEPENE